MGEQTNPPPSIKLTRRATANALWAPLRHALQDTWPTPTNWIHHDPRGNPHTTDHQTGGIPGPLPTYTPTNETGRIIGRLDHTDWPSNGKILYARLTEDDYAMLYAKLDMTRMYEWHTTIQHTTARVPFLLDTNRHGTPTLRRNHDPRASITPATADFLEALAALAQVRLITPEQEALIEAALITDDDPIRATEVFAIATRAGITPD